MIRQIQHILFFDFTVANGTVDVTVLPVGSPNTVLASDDYDTTTGVIPATGTVVTNDTNPDDLSAIAAVIQNVVLAEGTFVLNADGTYVFTPATGFSGTVNIPYTITDSGSPVATSTATLHIVVSILPVTTPDVNAGNVGDEIPGNVATNDEVPAGTTYGPATGLPGNPDGTLPVINPVTGSYTFTPVLPGVYAFDVPVCVGTTTPCPTVPLVIVVIDPLLNTNLPIAINDTSVTPINTPVVIHVESNDGPGNIGGVLGNATTVTAPTNGLAVINPDGTITYTPNAGYFGPDSFEYTICETPSGLCSTATVDVSVLPVGSPNTLLASDDFDTATVLNPATGTVITNDTNPDDLSAIVAVTQNVVLAEGTFVLNANGSYSFVPLEGFSGTVDIPYTITDAGSPVATSTATLHIVVSVLHDLIAAEDGTFYYDFSSTQNGTFPIFSNDTINDDVVVPSLFTFTLDNDGGLIGATIDASGNLIVPVGTDPGTYILTYTICENALAGNCDTATIIVNVFEFEVFNAFTPGGGDINENFVIEGIQHFPNNSVEIYNRWGVLVYEVTGYDNEERSFDGTSEGRVTIEKGSKLPDGTYFYVIKYVDFEGVAKEKAGYLFIKRQ